MSEWTQKKKTIITNSLNKNRIAVEITISVSIALFTNDEQYQN